MVIDTVRKSVNIINPVSPTTIFGWPAVLFSLPFIGICTYIALTALKIIPSLGRPQSYNVSRELVAAFGGLFVMAGLAVLIHGFISLRDQSHRQRLLLKYPDQSWLADYRWNPKGIAGDELRKVYKTFGGAIGIIIFFIPFNWFAFFTKDIPSIFAVFVGFFDFFIILGLAYGSYLFLRFLKYGTSFLQFNQFPFFLDDKVDAVLNTEAIKGLKDMVVTLRCIEEKYETRGTGRNRSTVIVSYQIYADSVKFDNAGQSQHMRLYLPVSFPLPRDLNYNTALSVRPAKYWQMELKAATPGINYLSTFLIPVYVRNG